jgi:hypothetical protein
VTLPPPLQRRHSGSSSHKWPETLVFVCCQVSVLRKLPRWDKGLPKGDRGWGRELRSGANQSAHPEPRAES